MTTARFEGIPLVLVGAMALSGCPGPDGDDSDGPPVCDVRVVSDIDETLTVSDEEFLQLLLDPTHEVEMRPEANAAMQDWADAGHIITYLTARGAEMELSDGQSVFDATDAWLDQHGFPRSDGDLLLAPGNGVLGQDAADHKTETLQALLDTGTTIAAAYGNADTDLQAYDNVGLSPDQVWVVGELAGDPRGMALPDDEAYAAHRATLDVPLACP